MSLAMKNVFPCDIISKRAINLCYSSPKSNCFVIAISQKVKESKKTLCSDKAKGNPCNQIGIKVHRVWKMVAE